jgi:phage shock protein PspC (stress-responsive transcriptional regulator)
MKKVISIHLNNKMFHIEEDAYAYLNNALSGQWKKQELEAQVAERLEQKLIGSKIVVTYPDAVDVLYQLGFSASDYQAPSSNLREKRLSRQPNDKMIGGVCTGLGEFFEIDPVIFRVLFVLGFFMFWGFIAYIILWIIVPKAPNSLTV